MAQALKPLLAGNWKMFGRAADLAEIGALNTQLGAAATAVDVLICPAAAYVAQAKWAARQTAILIGAQDCSPEPKDGARTGDISAAMLADAGASYVIVGHSERRAIFGDADALVRRKAEAAIAAGLMPIVCVGETRADRDGGRELEIVSAQVRASCPETHAPMVIAYEPVWCIGADRIPTSAEITAMHGAIRAVLAECYGAAGQGVRILYGGSVNPKNAAEVFSCAGVDGALVGRASLKAADFAAIIVAHPAAA